MRDYLIFIDVETSGLPKNWERPYSNKGNWPYAIQVSWIIYNKNGTEVKQENHYIKDKNINISKSSIKVHGITKPFLDDSGERRKKILNLLNKDLKKFQPLIVGHFIELDIHVLGAEYYRSGIENGLSKLSSICTMNTTRHLANNPHKKFLRLPELYQLLFETTISNQHNALEDARATSICFFELLKRGHIKYEEIELLKKTITEPKGNIEKKGCGLFLVSILLLMLIYIKFL